MTPADDRNLLSLIERALAVVEDHLATSGQAELGSAYEAAATIRFAGGWYRKDIADQAIKPRKPG